MSKLIRKSLNDPEEIRPFQDGMGQLELVNLEGGPVGRATFQPGWPGPSTSSRSPRLTAARPPTPATSSRDG
jgi:hypothetical protein